MRYDFYKASSPYEIGDTIIYQGEHKIITDILFLHFTKSKKTDIKYELDDNKTFISLSIDQNEIIR